MTSAALFLCAGKSLEILLQHFIVRLSFLRLCPRLQKLDYRQQTLDTEHGPAYALNLSCLATDLPGWIRFCAYAKSTLEVRVTLSDSSGPVHYRFKCYRDSGRTHGPCGKGPEM